MNYALLITQLKNVLSQEDYDISKMANISAFIFEHLDNINWVGFYIVKDNILKLGPFQGKIACSNIPKGKGVCGTAWQLRKTMIVDNVHEFPGHIACDENSKSEVVIPIFDNNGEMILELDIDSPIYSRFTTDDVNFLKNCAKFLGNIAE